MHQTTLLELLNELLELNGGKVLGNCIILKGMQQVGIPQVTIQLALE